jgi:membrane protein required for colicin V production
MLIDIVLIALLIMALLKGLRKGLIVAVFSFLALLIGLVAATKLSAITASYLQGTVNVSAKWLPVIAFIVVFLLASFLVRLGAKAIEKLAKIAMLGWLNKIGGVLFFQLMYVMVFSVVLFYGSRLHIISEEAIKKSVSYPLIQNLGPNVITGIGKVIPAFKDMFTVLENFFNSLAHTIPKAGK